MTDEDEQRAVYQRMAARVLAAIEKTERIARAAADSARGHDDFGTGHGIFTGSPTIALHIRLQDPNATLIRCAADRELVAATVALMEDCISTDERTFAAFVLETRAKVYGISTEAVDDECE